MLVRERHWDPKKIQRSYLRWKKEEEYEEIARAHTDALVAPLLSSCVIFGRPSCAH
jgi:hypothetical protein